jgi:PBP1b-binding outer membrane lipoprotein LpoB
MLKSALCLTLAVGAVALVGCEKDKDTTPPPAVVPSTQPSAVTPPPAPVVPAVPVTPVPPVTPAPTPAPSADAVDPSIQALMDKAVDDVKNKKWSDAEDDLKKLEDMKDKLPAGWMDKIKGLKDAVAAGKLSSSIPGFGK